MSSKPISTSVSYPFLNGGGEMGALMRSHDWVATSLGSPGSWPQSLKTIISLIINSNFPQFLFWGKELLCFYNDAYRPSLGRDGKHPGILGQPAEVAWQETWPVIGPLIDSVLAGEGATWSEDQLIPIYRNGGMEDVYWTFSHSPAMDESGSIAGVLVTCTETTGKVMALQKLEDNLKLVHESEERFRIMAEGTDILIAASNETGDAVYFNQAWSDITGRSMEELLKFGWADLMHPDDKERVITTFMEAFKSASPFTWEFRMPDAKGDYRWLLAKGTPRFKTDGSFAGYISSSFDITGRKQSELSLVNSTEELQSINAKLARSNEELASTNEELTAANQELVSMQQELLHQTTERQFAIERLNASEQNIRNMVRQAPVGMCIVEGDPLYMTEMNDSFLEIIGRTRQEVKSKPYWKVIPEAKATYEPITNEVLATGKTYRAYEHEIMLVRNGIAEKVYVDFVYEPMTDFQGKSYAIMIVAIDITDKVVARKKVERAEESLRMAVDAAELGTYFINATDRIFHPSPRLKEFFGFLPDEEVPYDAAISQIHEDYRQQAANMVEAAFTKGERFDMEYPIVGYHDGAIRWVRGIGEMQHYDDKDFFTGVLHDITESKKDEMRKNDFIGMVSHELKTPLTSLNAIIQVVNSKLKNTQDQFLTDAMSKAGVQVKRMGSMINGFLNLSRLESGKIHIEKAHFDLEQLVQEITDEVKVSVTSHTISFAKCEPVEIYADRKKINSVISNLIGNAVKYLPRDTSVFINCSAHDTDVQVSVKDEGIGIKSSDAAKIFDRYYRIEDTSTRHISGFGIGLYLSAEIVERHGGRIWLESEPGKGSTFYFSLPL